MPRIISPEDEAEINRIKVMLVNDIWSAENTVLDETSWGRMKQRTDCIHKDLDLLRVTLERILDIDLTINEDEQTVPYPFSENGGGK